MMRKLLLLLAAKALIKVLVLATCFLVPLAMQAEAEHKGAASDFKAVKNESKSAGSALPKPLYQNWHDAARNRDVPVKIYMPAEDGHRHPLVVFSHGLGGDREAAVYLGKYWSDHGYVSVHVQHPGSDRKVWEPVATQGMNAIKEQMNSAVNLQSFMGRIGDIKFVLDELEKRNASDPQLRGKLDLSKIAIAGHSYGAGTSLTMAGQMYGNNRRQMNFADPRIKCAIYLSPPVNLRGRTAEEVFGNIKIPGMVLTGTLDDSPLSRNSAADRRIPFDGMRAPEQYLVNFEGADHMIFNGRRRGDPHPHDDLHMRQIERLTTAFLDAYLRGDAREKQWLTSEAPKYLGTGATFEQKH
jgi:predicted dienelactone hydrolase